MTDFDNPKRASEKEVLENIMLEEPGTLEEFPLLGDNREPIGALWFGGLPSWLSEVDAEQEFGIGTWDDVITIVDFWGEGVESFTVNGRLYTRKAHLAPFGERECPLTGTDEGFQSDSQCYYCEQTKEEGHGHLYVGEFALNIYSTPDSDND